MLVQQADMGEGSGQPTDPQHTSTTASPSQIKPITIPSSSRPQKTHRPRKAKKPTEISQSSRPIYILERAATSASSLEAEHVSGDAEAQTRFKTAFKQSNDLPLSRVNTLGSG
ncbi:hypothetical protein Tco_0203722 [Tanacetum coccineum]